jgi:hypothetical protein
VKLNFLAQKLIIFLPEVILSSVKNTDTGPVFGLGIGIGICQFIGIGIGIENWTESRDPGFGIPIPFLRNTNSQ